MPVLHLPENVEAVLRQFYTCEFTTITRQGQPITWPTEPFYDRAEGRLIITASIAFAAKAANARRNPKVSMLFSDPTGSRLLDPPAVLVQGQASVVEAEQVTPWSLEMFRISLQRQPASQQFIANPLVRRLFQFYFQRIAILVHPERIRVWPHRDFQGDPIEFEVTYVE